MMKLILGSYIGVINLVGFIAMWMDKRKAKAGKSRISEKSLMTITALGGAVGTLIAMVLCHHKLSKKKFYRGVPGLLMIHVLAYAYFYYAFIEINLPEMLSFLN